MTDRRREGDGVVGRGPSYPSFSPGLWRALWFGVPASLLRCYLVSPA